MHTKFLTAINIYKAISIPFTHIDQIVFTAETYKTYGKLLTLPLSTVTSLLCRDLNKANAEYSAYSYTTFLAGKPDKTRATYTGPFKRRTDIVSSSIAQAALVLQFRRLGMPEFTRRLNLFPLPGTLYFYPPEAFGDLKLLVCLSGKEISGLKENTHGGGASAGPCRLGYSGVSQRTCTWGSVIS